MGQPQLKTAAKSLSEGARRNPQAIALWMTDNVPCLVGRIPKDWTLLVITSLIEAQVDHGVIRQAFAAAKTKGWDFTPAGPALIQGTWVDTGKFFPAPPAPPYLYRPGYVPTSMGTPHRAEDWSPLAIQNVMGALEVQYMRAIAVHDPALMEAILAAALQALWEYAKHRARLKQASDLPKLREWEEFNQAVREAFANAYQLQQNVQRLTWQDIRDLRLYDSPGSSVRYDGPDFVRLVRVRLPQAPVLIEAEAEVESEAD